MGVQKGIRRPGLCYREGKEWEEAEEKGEDKINPAGELAGAEVVALAPAVIVSAQIVEPKHPMKGVPPALKSNAPNVAQI
ncbi:MAG: hypothetical protein PVH02_06380 [Desulfobacteraceae bacterium]|jgi:hypothetical protein